MTAPDSIDVDVQAARELRLAEVTLRTFARSATGPDDRPRLIAVLLAEYDRRGALLAAARAETLRQAADRLDEQAAAHAEAIHDYTDLLRLWADDTDRWESGA